MNTVAASTAHSWRAWLAQNGRSGKEIWLIIHHKDSAIQSVRYHEAIEQALCFGWIDGLHRKHDADSSRLRFTPRRSTSTWSKINRERAANMIEQGLMTAHGQEIIDLAKSNGNWQVVSDDASSEMPTDLHVLMMRNKAANANFQKFPPSSKRLILEWIAKAKRPDTRQRRIEATVDLAGRNIRANHPVREN